MTFELTPPPQPLPSLNDPATFNQRALSLFTWLVQTFIPQMEAITPSDLLAELTNGTAAAPSLAWLSDPDTGFYRAGANQLGIAVGGVMRALLSGSAFQLNVPMTGTAVQSTPDDKTAGKLMPVGAFGLGAADTPGITNFTQEIAPGFYRYYEQSAINAPGSGSSYGGYVFVNRLDGSGGTLFLAFRATATIGNRKAWLGIRTSSTGTVTWTPLYIGGNVLDAVSQSGGVPTGGIIERGSNANGDYIKFADGTMMCWQTVTFTYQSGARLGASWTFPAPFANAGAAISGSYSAASGSYTSMASWEVGAINTLGLTATSVTVGCMHPTNLTYSASAAASSIRVLAVGRWF